MLQKSVLDHPCQAGKALLLALEGINLQPHLRNGAHQGSSLQREEGNRPWQSPSGALAPRPGPCTTHTALKPKPAQRLGQQWRDTRLLHDEQTTFAQKKNNGIRKASSQAAGPTCTGSVCTLRNSAGRSFISARVASCRAAACRGEAAGH